VSRLRLVLVPVVAVGILLLGSAPAFADGNGSITYTQTDKNLTQTFHDLIPCVGPGTITITQNDVFHVTINKAGDFWDTFNAEGTFSAVPDDLLAPTYTGHFHDWGGDSDNRQNTVSHSTFSVNGRGSDGSHLVFHETMHYSVSASGVTIWFDKPTCG
jgi:hypothetical protein